MQMRTRNEAVVSVPQFIGSPATGAGMVVSHRGNISYYRRQLL